MIEHAVRLGGYSLITLWVLIVGAALADRYDLAPGFVAVSGFLLGVAYAFAALWEAPDA